MLGAGCSAIPSHWPVNALWVTKQPSGVGDSRWGHAAFDRHGEGKQTPGHNLLPVSSKDSRKRTSSHSPRDSLNIHLRFFSIKMCHLKFQETEHWLAPRILGGRHWCPLSWNSLEFSFLQWVWRKHRRAGAKQPLLWREATSVVLLPPSVPDLGSLQGLRDTRVMWGLQHFYKPTDLELSWAADNTDEWSKTWHMFSFLLICLSSQHPNFIEVQLTKINRACWLVMRSPGRWTEGLSPCVFPHLNLNTNLVKITHLSGTQGDASMSIDVITTVKPMNTFMISCGYHLVGSSSTATDTQYRIVDCSYHPVPYVSGTCESFKMLSLTHVAHFPHPTPWGSNSLFVRGWLFQILHVSDTRGHVSIWDWIISVKHRAIQLIDMVLFFFPFFGWVILHFSYI